MSEKEIKLRCLEIAISLGNKDEKTALETAKKLYAFLADGF